jgi:DNA-binding winged helix-turn-helix (wHTH) protein
MRFGAFEVDLRSGELHKQGIRLKLQDQPFQVLTLLLERAGEVVTREELRQKLWPGDTFVDFDNGLNSAIKKLRDALCDSAEEPRYIETLPRRGYRFIAPVYSAPVPSQLSTPEVAAPGIQIHAGEIQPAKINESDGSSETSSAALSNSASKLVPPALNASFPLPSRTLAGNRRRTVRAVLALGIVFAVVAMGQCFCSVAAPQRTICSLPSGPSPCFLWKTSPVILLRSISPTASPMPSSPSWRKSEG